jgi:hypothetical protein
MSDETPKAPASVYEHIAMIMDQIASVSWQKLGLQPDIITGKLDKNLAEAKVAVDLTAHLAGILEAKLDDEDRRRVQSLVTDLRLNFIQKSREGES